MKLHHSPSPACLRDPRRSNQPRPNRHSQPAEDLQIQIPTVIFRDELACDRVPGQGSDADDEETRARADTDVLDFGDLHHQGGGHGDEGAGGEAEQGGEGDDGPVARGGDPHGQHEEGGQGGGDDHDVEAADFVPQPAGDDAPEDTGAVKDRDQVLRERGVHAEMLAFEDEEVEGEEDAPEEEKAAERVEQEGRFAEGTEELHGGYGAGFGCGAVFEREHGDYEQAAEHECNGPHHPGEANVGEKTSDHDPGDWISRRIGIKFGGLTGRDIH